MRPLEHIHDADTLRQIAVLQQRQIEILAERLQAIQRRIDEAKAEDAQLVFLSEIGRLEQQVAKLEQHAFGDSSERRRSSRGATDEPADPARGHGGLDRLTDAAQLLWLGRARARRAGSRRLGAHRFRHPCLVAARLVPSFSEIRTIRRTGHATVFCGFC